MRRSLFLFSCLILVGCTHLSHAQRQHGARGTASGGALMPEQAAYDVTFYDLALSVEPADSTIEGTLTVHARLVQPVEYLVLDLDTTLSVSDVRLNAGDRAAPLSFEHREGKLWCDFGGMMQPGEEVVVEVAYGGAPRVAPNPPWIGGFTWARASSGEPWIATTVQVDGADLWWPAKDHPSDEPDSVALHITVPERLVVASNGRLREVTETEDGRPTYHWFVSTPINNYNVALNIAPYRTIEGTYESVSGDSIPVTFWVLPEAYEKGEELFPQFAEHLRFYEERLGPYPFRADKYGVVHTPHLGMEHQTIIAYGNDFTDNEFGFDFLHHHELGHEWWGNLVSAADWRDFWIHEGFCSYMQALYAEELGGEEAYHRYMAGSRGGIGNRQPVAPREARSTQQMYFVAPDYTQSDGDIYAKGAWVLHTLRYLIGDEAFAEALHRMAYPDPAMEHVTEGGQTRFATTDDFLRIAEETSGQELGWFFEVYLRQPELPQLVVETDENGSRMHWDVPGNLPFPMPVEVEVDGETQRIAMPQGAASLPDSATADPKGWILKQQ